MTRHRQQPGRRRGTADLKKRRKNARQRAAYDRWYAEPCVSDGVAWPSAAVTAPWIAHSDVFPLLSILHRWPGGPVTGVSMRRGRVKFASQEEAIHWCSAPGCAKCGRVAGEGPPPEQVRAMLDAFGPGWLADKILGPDADDVSAGVAPDVDREDELLAINGLFRVPGSPFLGIMNRDTGRPDGLAPPWDAAVARMRARVAAGLPAIEDVSVEVRSS